MSGKRWAQWPCGCYVICDDGDVSIGGPGHVYEVSVCRFHVLQWLQELQGVKLDDRQQLTFPLKPGGNGQAPK